MSGEVEKCPILHVRPKFDVFTLTRYCSVECQRKDWDFHRFACAVVAKKSDTVKA